MEHLRQAYAAMNGGDPTPLVALFDPQVHLRGPERGYLCWKTTSTWNGPDELLAVMTRRCQPRPAHARQVEDDAIDHRDLDSADPDSAPGLTDAGAMRTGQPTRLGDRVVVEYLALANDPQIVYERGSATQFLEVITMRRGRIVRLCDYRRPADAMAAAIDRR